MEPFSIGKLGKELFWKASYEKLVLEYLNKNKINFDWQIKFETPFLTKRGNKKVYFVDLYLPGRDLYVEIKGYFINKISKQKWDWFHSEYPNSELWNKEKLKEMKII